MSQRFVCGMRRFDKHRVSSNSRDSSASDATELQERLRQREEQDKMLCGTSPVLSPSVLSTSPISLAPPPSPVLLSESGPICPPAYTPWKTPSASSSSPAPVPSPATKKG